MVLFFANVYYSIRAEIWEQDANMRVAGDIPVSHPHNSGYYRTRINRGVMIMTYWCNKK